MSRFGFVYLLKALGSLHFEKVKVLGSKDLDFYVFRTLICIVGKP